MTSTTSKLAVLVALALLALVAVGKDLAVAPVSADDALATLKAGNQRFATNPISEGKPTAARRAETALSQHPFAIVLGCADSRSAPEFVFDQNIGDLFVVRTAGNLVDEYGIGSIEYAVTHFETRLIVVLGHERCGAVKGAMEAETAPGHIGAILREIQPAVRAARKMEGDTFVNAIHANTTSVAARIKRECDFGSLASQVRIISGYYDLDTGVVEWQRD